MCERSRSTALCVPAFGHFLDDFGREDVRIRHLGNVQERWLDQGSQSSHAAPALIKSADPLRGSHGHDFFRL
jgi:hypothetical protein